MASQDRHFLLDIHQDIAKFLTRMPTHLSDLDEHPPLKKKFKYYAVAVGKEPGIYTSWEECKEQTQGVKFKKFKSFTDVKEASYYLLENYRPAALRPSIKERLQLPHLESAIQKQASVFNSEHESLSDPE